MCAARAYADGVLCFALKVCAVPCNRVAVTVGLVIATKSKNRKCAYNKTFEVRCTHNLGWLPGVYFYDALCFLCRGETIEKFPVVAWKKVMAINVESPFYLTRALCVLYIFSVNVACLLFMSE